MKIVVLICVCMTRSILIDANKVGFMSCYNLFYVLIISLCVSICSKMHYPPPKVSQNCHGKAQNLRTKTKYLTAKPKTSRLFVAAKTKTSRQNRKPSRQNQRLQSKNQIPQGKSKYRRQNQSYFVFAVKYLVLP